ncbi:MAG TPA: proline iminopeptidase-family hydrolase [Gammaproteobacteria bacterium]|nr:proline iminopeptidase-family hydrolase [Gammaproteobacteria bacterium]
MPELDSAREGLAAFRGFRTRFRVVGRGRARRPLLCIHGGPGLGMAYLQPLEEMHTTGRQVVFYDQLGCGGSDHPGTDFGWSLELFLDELDAVRAAAGLDTCHLLGHGWGGMLALEHALRRPAGIASLVLSSAVASVPQWRRELVTLVAALPEEIRLPLYQHSAAGTAGSPDCCCVVDAVLRRNLCRLSPWPDCLERSHREARQHPEARNAMLGPNELEPAGQLAGWDVTSRLGEIKSPTLVVSGRHDLVTPPMAAALYQGIPGSEWVVFEHSAHVPHLEEPQRYLEVLDGFLDKAEDAQR